MPGKRGYQRSEGVRQAAFQDRQPDLNEPVGAAPAPTHRLFFGHAPLDHPVDHRFDRGGGDALAPAGDRAKPEATVRAVQFR